MTTIFTDGISSPLLATLLHTRMLHSPALNLFKAPSLLDRENSIDRFGMTKINAAERNGVRDQGETSFNSVEQLHAYAFSTYLAHMTIDRNGP